jgi:hypothetical protein
MEDAPASRESMVALAERVQKLESVMARVLDRLLVLERLLPPEQGPVRGHSADRP